MKPEKEYLDEQLILLITEYQTLAEGTLGYRSMTMVINRFNSTNYSLNYIHRLMKLSNNQARIRRKKVNRKAYKPEQIGENTLNREFTAHYSNEKWCSDVTEFKIPNSNKKLYLCAIKDLYDKSIVAYKMSNRNSNYLVFKTFDLAMEKNLGATPIFHSDRGFQYTSIVFKAKLDEANMTQSMSRVGRCIDNSPIESFWGTLKSEMYYGVQIKDEQDLRNRIDNYIDYYNNHRLQSKLKSLSPNEVRYQTLNENSIFNYF